MWPRLGNVEELRVVATIALLTVAGRVCGFPDLVKQLQQGAYGLVRRSVASAVASRMTLAISLQICQIQHGSIC